MNDLIGSICLSDIPKELIRTGSNGKKYLSVVVARRREVGRFGDTHYIKAYCKSSERKEGVNYYIGELKESTYTKDAPVQQAVVPADPAIEYMKAATQSAPATPEPRTIELTAQPAIFTTHPTDDLPF